jgi:hypothetical protein
MGCPVVHSKVAIVPSAHKKIKVQIAGCLYGAESLMSDSPGQPESQSPIRNRVLFFLQRPGPCGTVKRFTSK